MARRNSNASNSYNQYMEYAQNVYDPEDEEKKRQKAEAEARRAAKQAEDLAARQAVRDQYLRENGQEARTRYQSYQDSNANIVIPFVKNVGAYDSDGKKVTNSNNKSAYIDEDGRLVMEQDNAYNLYKNYMTQVKSQRGMADNTQYADDDNSIQAYLKTANDYLNNMNSDAKKYLDDYKKATEEYDKVSEYTADSVDMPNVAGQTEASKKRKEALDGLKNSLGEDEYKKAMNYYQYLSDAEKTEAMRKEAEGAVKGANTASNIVGGIANFGADYLMGAFSGIGSTAEIVGHKLFGYDKSAPVNTNSALYRMQNYADFGRNETIKAAEDSGHPYLAKGLEYTAAGMESLRDASIGSAFGEAFTAGKTYANKKAFKEAFAKYSSMATLPNLGLRALGSSLSQNQQRGLSGDNAITSSVVSGVTEALSELVPFDFMFGIIGKQGTKAAKGVIVDVLKEAGFEGLEEVTSDVVNRIADAAINQDKSELNSAVRYYMSSDGGGLSEEEAKKKANNEWWSGLVGSFLGGAVVGGVMGGGAEVGNTLRTNRIANYDIRSKGGMKGFADSINTAEYIKDESHDKAVEAKEKANALAKAEEEGKTITNKQKREIYNLLADADDIEGNELKESRENYKNNQQKIIDEAREAHESGESTENYDVADKNDLDDTEFGEEYIPQEYKDQYKNDMSSDDIAAKMADALKNNDARGIEEARRLGLASSDEATVENTEKLYDEYARSAIDKGVATREEMRGLTDELSKANAYRAAMNNKTVRVNQDTAAVVKEARAKRIELQAQMRETADNVSGLKVTSTNEGVKVTGAGESVTLNKVANDAASYSSKQTAENYIALYSENTNVPATSFKKAFDRFYIGASSGKTFDEIINEKGGINMTTLMSEGTLKKMYDEGVKDMSSNTRNSSDNVKKGTGKVTYDVKNKNKIKYRHFFEAYAKATGIDIVFTDKLEDNINGSFIKSASQIVFNVNSQKGFNTFFHEAVGEFTEAWNASGMKEVQEAILNYTIDKVGYDKAADAFKAYREGYQEVGRKEGSADANETMREAMDEFVNDSIAGLFATEDGMKDFAEWLDKNMPNEKQGILDKIADFLTQVIEAMDKMLKTSKLAGGSRVMAEAEREQAAKLRQQVLDAMSGALDNYKAATTFAESKKNAKEFLGGETYTAKELESPKHSINLNPKLMQNAMNKNDGRVDQKVMKDAKAMREHVADFLSKYTHLLPEDVAGNIVVSNGSYAKSVENSLICVRSLVSGNFMDIVSDKVGRPLTIDEQIVASQILAEITGEQTECTYCYVKNDRAKYREFFNEYYRQYSDVFDKVQANPDAYKANTMHGYNEFLNGRADTQPMKDRYKMFVKDALKGQKSLELSDLTTATKRAILKAKGGAKAGLVNDAEKYCKGAAWPKSTSRKVKGRELEYIAYNGNILNWKQPAINKLNSGFGLRMYSDSDYVPAFLLENMQVVTDAAVKGLKMLAYTKDAGFAEVFGKTGMGINISVFGQYDEQTGTVHMDGMMGADWDRAKAVRAKYDNVGTVFVATNDKAVEWALDQDWIDVVIPFHTVRTGAEVAKYYGYKDYKSQQEDAKSGDWKEENARRKAEGRQELMKSIAPTVHGNNKETYLQALKDNHLTPRFEKWIKHPNYMKLVNETRMSYLDMNPVQPIFDAEAVERELARIPKEGAYGVMQNATAERQAKYMEHFSNKAVKAITAEDGVKHSINVNNPNIDSFITKEEKEKLGVFMMKVSNGTTESFYEAPDGKIVVSNISDKSVYVVDRDGDYDDYNVDEIIDIDSSDELIQGIVKGEVINYEIHKGNGIPISQYIVFALSRHGGGSVGEASVTIWDTSRMGRASIIRFGNAGNVSRETYSSNRVGSIGRGIQYESVSTSLGNQSEISSRPVKDNLGRPLSKGQSEFYGHSKLRTKGNELVVMYKGAKDRLFKTSKQGKNSVEYYLNLTSPYIAQQFEDIDENELSNNHDGVIYVKNNQIISADVFEDGVAFETANEDPRYSININSEGTELTEGQKEFFKNSKAVDDEGRLKVFYHGSPDAGFTVFDPSFSDDRISLFFTDSPAVAKSYSGTYRDMSEGVINGKRMGYRNAANYAVYLNLENPLIIDAKGRNWNNISLDDSEFWGNNVKKFINYMHQGLEYEFDLMEMIEYVQYGSTFEETARGAIDYSADNDVMYNTYTREEEKEFIKCAKALDELYKAYDPDESDYDFFEEFENEVNRPTYNTRKLARKALEEGHDGVIFKNLYDMGRFGDERVNSTIAIAFKSNQIKSFENENPTLNDDIRYSIGFDALEDLLFDDGSFNADDYIIDDSGQTKAVNYQRDSMTKMASILEEGVKLLGKQNVPKAKIRDIAKKYVGQYGSTYNIGTLADNIEKVFAFMQNQKSADYEDLVHIMKEVASPVIDNARNVIDDGGQYQAFKDSLKGLTLAFSSAQAQEIKSQFGSLLAYERQFGGAVKFNQKTGQMLDTVWDDLVGRNTGILDAETNEGDMPLALLDALQGLAPTAKQNDAQAQFGMNNDDLAYDLAMQIITDCFDTSATQRVREQARKENTAYRNKVRARYNEKLKSGLSKQRARMRDTYQQRAENAAARHERAKTESLVKEMMTWLSEPTDKHHIPFVMQEPVADFLSAFDFVMPNIHEYKSGEHKGMFGASLFSHKENGRPVYEWVGAETREEAYRLVSQAQADLIANGYGAKNRRSWQERMRGFTDLLGKIRSDESGDTDLSNLALLLDASLEDAMTDVLYRNSEAVSVFNLKAEDLKAINKTLMNLRHAINNANKFFMQSAYATIPESAEHSIDFMSGKKAKKDKGTLREMAWRLMNISMVSPETYFHAIGADDVYENIREGLNRRTRDIKQASEYMAEVLKGVNVTPWIDGKITHTVKAEDGRTFTYTPAFAMSLYELSKRPDAVRHFEGGFLTGKINGKNVNENIAYHLSENAIQEVIGSLTEEQKRVADAMQRYMANQCADQGNDVSMKMYGYKKYTDPAYFPMRVDRNSIPMTDKNMAQQLFNSITNLGFTKKTNNKSRNALTIEDIFDVFTNHVTDMATYHGYAMSMSDAIRWFNYKAINKEEGKYDDTRNIKNAIERVGGKDMVSYFVNLVRDINGETADRSGETQFANKLIGNYKAASVGANLRVAIQQPTAYLRASMVIDSKYLLKALDLKNTLHLEKTAQYAQEHSAIAYWKSNGYWDVGLGQSMKQVITGQSTLSDKLRDAGSILAQKGDDYTWGLLYKAVELEVADKNKGMDKSSDEFRELVNKRMDEVVDRTQVVDSVLHRSQFMRSKDGLVKIEAAFQAEPTKSYNLLYRAVIDGDKKEIGRAVGVFIFTNVLVAAAASIIDAFRNDDDEKEWTERYLEALLGFESDQTTGEKLIGFMNGNVGGNLNVAALLPYVKDIFSMLQGFEVDRMDVAGLSNFITAAQQTVKFAKGEGNKTAYGVSKNLVKAASQLTGVPAYGLLREVESVHNAFADNWQTKKAGDYDGIKKSINKYTTDEAIAEAVTKAEQKKMADGKTEKEADTAIKSSITSTYKEQFIELYNTDLGAAADLKNKLIKAFMEAGDTREQAIKKIDKWVK